MRISGNLHLTNVPKELAATLKKKIRLKNPTYYQAIKRNPRAKYTLSPYINYYEERRHGNTSELVVPRGLYQSLRHYLEQEGFETHTIDERVCREVDIRDTIELRDYQRGVPDRIARHAHGIVRADTGFGKSIIAIRTAALLGQRTLIIVPKLDLLNQFAYDIEQYTGEAAGIIQGKQLDIRNITVATYQTIAKRLREGRLTGKEFGCTMVDECHQFTTPRARETIGLISSRFLYGFTATARRTDGQGHALRWIFGPILIDKKLPRRTPEVEIVPFTGRIPVTEYADMIQLQVENEERNALIVSLAQREIQKGRKLLILTKRVNHYEKLQEQLASPYTFAIRSSGKKEERGALLRGFKDGSQEFNCLLGTYSLLSTGVDIPSLDTLILAGDLKSNVLQEQSVGRILRLFDGKPTPKIIDIHDQGNGILRNQGRLRQRFYEEQEWKVLTS